MKKVIGIVIAILIILFIIGSIMFFNIFGNNIIEILDKIKNKNNDTASLSDLDKLKKYFEEYSAIQIFLKSNVTIEQTNEFANKLNSLKYLKDIKVISKEDSYNELKIRIGDSVGSIEQFSVPNKIRSKFYYFDDISLLDENTYFDKIKNAIIEVDTNNIIENIVTAGIIEIYNKEGMEGVEEYVEKNSYIDNKYKNNINASDDITQKISEGKVVSSGIINNIDDKYIYYSSNNSKQLYFEKNVFSYINGRTFNNMTISDVKAGDYIYPFRKQILIYRNIIEFL